MSEMPVCPCRILIMTLKFFPKTIRVKNAKDYMNYDYCLIHEHEKLNLYCSKEECGMPVCRVCAETTHNHGTSTPVNIKTVYDKKKEELQLYSFELEKKIQETQNRITDVEKEMVKIPTDSEKTKEDVRGAIEACMELLYNRANELHQEVDKIQSFKLQALNAQKQELVKNKALLEDGQQFLQQTLTYSNVPAFLQIVPTIAKQLVTIGNDSIPTGPTVKSDLYFSMQGLGKDFQNHILSMGKIMTKNIHPASCRANIHGDVNKGQGLRLTITLKDYEGNVIQDKFVNVVMKISDSEGNTRSEDCLLSNSGTYDATFNLDKHGRHGIVILASGQPIKTLSVERAESIGYDKLSLTNSNKSPSSDNSIEVNISQSVSSTTKQEADSCSMCGDITNKNASKLPCGHVFGKECIGEVFKYGSACPICGNAHETMYGDQPDGTMKIRVFPQTKLPGFEEFGTIEVMYHFPSGIQGEGQPMPGEWYEGLTRRGYLPNNKEGRLIARLLREAFYRRVVFTFKENKSGKYVVSWNSIYHKTRTHGGAKRHGYPDRVYLDRVKQDLAYNGITEECLNEP
ncbi:hypothetical protein KUTeg_010086 [Tegillarca granosa]|uniref:E3 ubiquitin-protein ligase n=1 Tax=Tegillarca granosa TaxID=220873 RepID=A0ABQ9F5Q4_TEGGR|nr:hypothetical protein KUTeg_010086 [Tegillarca granosa]